MNPQGAAAPGMHPDRAMQNAMPVGLPTSFATVHHTNYSQPRHHNFNNRQQPQAQVRFPPQQMPFPFQQQNLHQQPQQQYSYQQQQQHQFANQDQRSAQKRTIDGQFVGAQHGGSFQHQNRGGSRGGGRGGSRGGFDSARGGRGGRGGFDNNRGGRGGSRGGGGGHFHASSHNSHPNKYGGGGGGTGDFSAYAPRDALIDPWNVLLPPQLRTAPIPRAPPAQPITQPAVSASVHTQNQDQHQELPEPEAPVDDDDILSGGEEKDTSVTPNIAIFATSGDDASAAIPSSVTSLLESANSISSSSTPSTLPPSIPSSSVSSLPTPARPAGFNLPPPKFTAAAGGANDISSRGLDETEGAPSLPSSSARVTSLSLPPPTSTSQESDSVTMSESGGVVGDSQVTGAGAKPFAVAGVYDWDDDE